MEKLEIFILDIIQQHSNIIKILHDKVILYETLMEDEISDIIGSELFNSIQNSYLNLFKYTTGKYYMIKFILENKISNRK